MPNVKVAAHGAALSPLLLPGPVAAPRAGLTFCPDVHPKSPLVELSKYPKQDFRMSNVLCERASPGKDSPTLGVQRRHLPFGGGDDTCSSAVTPAPALAAEMPERGSSGSYMGGRQKEANPCSGDPGSPDGAQLAPAAPPLCANLASMQPPGPELDGKENSEASSLRSFICVREEGARAAERAATRLRAEIQGPRFLVRIFAAQCLWCAAFLHR